jgi:hypothetical protein
MNPEEAAQLAQRLHQDIPKPVTERWLKRAVAEGMIPASELRDGHSYLGRSRNATIGVWDERERQFAHIRIRFGKRSIARVEHPEHDCGYDVFVPTLELPSLAPGMDLREDDGLILSPGRRLL